MISITATRAVLALLVTALMPWVGGAAHAADSGAEPHNIIVILADDMGVDMASPYEGFIDNHPAPGYPNTTPSLEYLSATGMVFRDVWINPTCSPARAQILTGRHTRNTGLGHAVGANWLLGLDSSIATIPSMLRSANYHTAAVGKWHLSDLNAPTPVTHALGDSELPWFDQYAGRIEQLAATGYNFWQKTFATTIDTLNDECSPAPCEAFVNSYATVDTTDDAIELLRTMPQPFFLYVPYHAPHVPLEAPEVQPMAASCPALVGNPVCTSTFDGTDAPRDTRCMMQWLDNEMGRLLCEVEAMRATSNPITVIFLADNGTIGEAIVEPFNPVRGKSTMYQLGVNVPFIVTSPLIPEELRGTTTRMPVSSTDLMATVAELSGAPMPADPHGLLDTVSILPYLQGDQTSRREFVYAEIFQDNFSPDKFGNPPPGWHPINHKQALRNAAGFKIIRIARIDQGEIVTVDSFYDLTADPWELTNRINQANQPPYDVHYQQLIAELDANYPSFMRDDDDDGMPDIADNCLGVANADQRDTDGDNIGNACDTDLNGDCSINFFDLGILKEVFFSSDPDADFDGNGAVDFLDLGIMKATFFGTPGPTSFPVCGNGSSQVAGGKGLHANRTTP